MNFKDSFKAFIKRYQITVLSESKRAIARPVRLFEYEHDKSIYTTSVSYDTEPMITIDIPLSKLEALHNLETIFYNNIDSSGQRRTFEVWMNAQEEERRLRYQFKAVDEAYKAYSALLTWCRNKPSEFKDLPDK